jgi:hypothetical protein
MLRFLYIVVTKKDLIVNIFHKAEREQHQCKEPTFQIEFIVWIDLMATTFATPHMSFFTSLANILLLLARFSC